MLLLLFCFVFYPAQVCTFTFNSFYAFSITESLSGYVCGEGGGGSGGGAGGEGGLCGCSRVWRGVGGV